MIDTENNDNDSGNSNSTDKGTNSGRQQAFSDGDRATSSNVDTENNQGVESESETEYESTDSNDSDIVSASVAKRIRGGATRPGWHIGVCDRGGIRQRGGGQPQNLENPVSTAADEVIHGQGCGRGAKRGANRARAVGKRQRNPIANWEKNRKRRYSQSP